MHSSKKTDEDENTKCLKKHHIQYDDMTITKSMTRHEYIMFMKAHKLGVTPEIVCSNPHNLTITMERGKCTLSHMDDKTKYSTTISKLIDTMHHNNLLHGDLHSLNLIMMDDNTIKAIDFEYSCMRNDISDEIIIKLSDIWYYSHGNYRACTTVDELFEDELQLYLR